MTGPFTHVTTFINSCSGGTKLNETKIPTNLSRSQLYTFILKGRERWGRNQRGGGVKRENQNIMRKLMKMAEKRPWVKEQAAKR
jgi:hypothetical protein